MKTDLNNAVLEQLGIDPSDMTEDDKSTLSDIRNHGVDGGFCGFVYYADTIEFYDNNKADILNLASEYAEEFGQSISEMIASFNCVESTMQEVESFLLGLDDENNTHLKNALSWFACEEVAREYDS